MTTPKPVALSELPVVARITPDLAETCCEWWWQRHAREVDQDRFTKKLVLHSDALSAIAMHRAEVERLSLALDEAVRRADEAEAKRDEWMDNADGWCHRFEASQANAATLLQRAKTAEARAAEVRERCAQVCDSIDMRNTRQGAADCAAAIRSLSSTTGATNKD